MPTIKKKDLINEVELEKAKVDELVDAEGGMISGDRTGNNPSEIQTGPYAKAPNDTSDYVKAKSTTTDRAARYKQNIPWFANYSGPRAASTVREVTTKNTVEEKIDDLVKKSKNSEIYDKNFNSKISKVVDTIEDGDFSPEQLEQIIKAINDKKANPSKTKSL